MKKSLHRARSRQQNLVAGAEPRPRRSFSLAVCRGDAPVAATPGHRWPAAPCGVGQSRAASFCPGHPNLCFSPAMIVLAAGNDDWIKIVIFAIAGLIYLINHFVGAAGKAQQRRQARPEGRPAPRPRAAAGRQEVQDEVAEFLKRAAEKRASTNAAEARPGQPRRVAESPPSLQTAEIVEARAVDELPSSRWPNPMQPPFESRELAARGGHLASADRADAAFQAHMQVFEHQVGRIHESAENPPAAEVQAEGPQTINAPPNEVFAALLSDPQSLRQAIILNEIIERPVERW